LLAEYVLTLKAGTKGHLAVCPCEGLVCENGRIGSLYVGRGMGIFASKSHTGVEDPSPHLKKAIILLVLLC
jgi:hypothetical protein